MSAGKIKVGVIGAGLFAEQCHFPGLQSHASAEVVMACARSEEKRKRAQDLFGIPETCSDFRQVIGRSDIDAIIIATPDALHKEVALASLAAGKHVFCEKPLALNLSEAAEMTEAAEKSGLVNIVAYTFRYTRAVQKLKHLIESGLIGTPLHAHMQVHWGDLLAPQSLSWREDAQQSSAGIWADAGSHLFDLLAFVLGPVEAVSAQMLVAKRAPGVAQPTSVDIASCQARLTWQKRLPVQVLMLTSRISAPMGPVHNFMVVGTEGSLGINLTRGNNECLQLMKPGAAWTDLPLEADALTDEPTALGRMMRAFVDAVVRGKADPELDASFRDGLNAQAAIEAGIVSADLGVWQNVQRLEPIRG
jgi:predicted dehydrogenase